MLKIRGGNKINEERRCLRVYGNWCGKFARSKERNFDGKIGNQHFYTRRRLFFFLDLEEDEKEKKKGEREIKQIADFGNDSIDFFSRMVSLFFERRRGNFIFDLGHCPPDQLLPPPR